MGPLDGKTITDDTWVRASIPTVQYLQKMGAKVLLASHLGRPKDGPEDKFSLGPVAPRLSELLSCEVKLAPDCIGDGVKACVDAMKEGDVILLENTRFYKEEEKNVPEFAEKLAANADLFVNDAFGTAHRAHGSTEGVTKYLDTLAEITSKNGCITIIGGGDSVAAVEKAGLAEKMSHISTGGGASLELLEGKVLPGVAALQEA